MNTWRNINKTLNEFDDLMKEFDSFILYDTETTGLNKEKDKIIQLSAFKLDKDLQVVDKFESYINPYPTVLLPKITELTGITWDDLKDAPKEDIVIPQFTEWSENSGFFAYNSGFDVGMYQGALARLGQEREIKHFDVLKLARDMLHDTENHKLITVSTYLDVIPENANFHSATFDVEMTLAVLKKLLSIRDNLPKSPENLIKPKIFALNPWSAGKMQRVYISTSIGSLYFDKIAKVYGAGTKDKPLDIHTIDMEYVEEQVLLMAVKGGYDSIEKVKEPIS